jgi:hypothetical protein
VKRNEQHVIDDRAQQLLATLLPDEWIIRDLPRDYGVDYEVEIVDQSTVTGNRIWLQLRGTEKDLPIREVQGSHPFRVDRPGPQPYVSVSVETKLLLYALRCGVPLLLFRADLPRGDIYWLPIRDDIRTNLDQRSPGWEDHESATVRLPIANSIFAEAASNWPGIRRYALEPARLASCTELHAIHHELQYFADLSSIEYDPTAVHPEVLERLSLRLEVAERGLKRAQLVGEGSELLPTLVRDDLVQAHEDSFRLQDSIKKGTIDQSSLFSTLADISQAIDSISTTITTYMHSRSLWVLYEDGKSKISGVF